MTAAALGKLVNMRLGSYGYLDPATGLPVVCSKAERRGESILFTGTNFNSEPHKQEIPACCEMNAFLLKKTQHKTIIRIQV